MVYVGSLSVEVDPREQDVSVTQEYAALGHNDRQRQRSLCCSVGGMGAVAGCRAVGRVGPTFQQTVSNSSRRWTVPLGLMSSSPGWMVARSSGQWRNST